MQVYRVNSLYGIAFGDDSSIANWVIATLLLWRPTWFPDILGTSSYPIFTKFGMQVYWVNSLYGIAFGDDSSIANWVIATLVSHLVSRHFRHQFLSYLYQIWYAGLLG